MSQWIETNGSDLHCCHAQNVLKLLSSIVSGTHVDVSSAKHVVLDMWTDQVLLSDMIMIHIATDSLVFVPVFGDL